MDQDIWNQGGGPLSQGARIVTAGVLSAFLTATIVIVIGQALIERHAPTRQTSASILIHTAG